MYTAGYAGEACKECTLGFYRLGQNCEKCPKGAYMLIVAAGLFIGLRLRRLYVFCTLSSSTSSQHSCPFV